MEKEKRYIPCAAGDENGYTLIEVLVAIAIFAIGILAVLQMQLSAINGNAMARKLTDNYTWAARRAEELMSLPYDDPTLTDTGGNFVTVAQDADGIDNDGDGRIDETGETGYVQMFMKVQDDTPSTGLKTVTVRITSSGRKRARTINIDFIKANM